MSGMVLAAIFAAGIAAMPNPVRVEQMGVFALLGGTPKIVSRFWVEHPSGLSATLKVRQFQPDGKTPVLAYDMEMEHLMHLVIVRDDFATFAHLHPVFDAQTGTFSQQFTKEPNHWYYVYADTTPQGIGQQVFRFTLGSSGAVSNPVSLSPSALSDSIGPYVVRLSRTTIRANRERNLNITILKDGEPADDLSPYLGVAAHVIIINAATLAYVHVHPMLRSDASGKSPGMNMPMGTSAQSGPFMQMTVPSLPVGSYKVWIQFLGGGDNVYTAPFTVLAR